MRISLGAFSSSQYIKIVPVSQTLEEQMIYFYAVPYDLDQNGNQLSIAYDPLSESPFYNSAIAGLGYGLTITLDAGPNPYGGGYSWQINIPPQEDTNGTPVGVTLLIYTQPLLGDGGH